MIHCARCAVDVQPFGDMQSDGRIVECCPKCNGAISAAPSRSVQTMQQVEAVAMPTRTAVLPVTDPVSVLRSRLQAVEAQIPTTDQLRALRRESTALRRALKALGADPAPRPN